MLEGDGVDNGWRRAKGSERFILGFLDLLRGELYTYERRVIFGPRVYEDVVYVRYVQTAVVQRSLTEVEVEHCVCAEIYEGESWAIK